jgi:hypothetical protein
MANPHSLRTIYLFFRPRVFCLCIISVFILFRPIPIWAIQEHPLQVAEKFFRALQQQDFKTVGTMLSRRDHLQARQFIEQSRKQTDPKQKEPMTLESLLANRFIFIKPYTDQKESHSKTLVGETVLPIRVGFFPAGQHYIVGPYAVVLTREIYQIAPEDKGRVQDDPRKLWVDPNNDLSKIRDEAFFKTWWFWEGEQLTLPGTLWMVREENTWKVDLLSGQVPRSAFRKILKWHFKRDIFDELAPPTPTPTSQVAKRKIPHNVTAPSHVPKKDQR